MEHIRPLSFGKTYSEPTAPTKEKTSGRSSKKSAPSPTIPYQFLDLQTISGSKQERSWETITPSHGGHSMPNTGECPNVAVASTLSQILEGNVPLKYYLSPLACSGVLRRAKNRGKELPPILKEALEKQAQIPS